MFRSYENTNKLVDSRLTLGILKYILGVHSRASNWAVESETNDRILQSSRKLRKSYYYRQFKIVNGVRKAKLHGSLVFRK